jgi:hypothetical protein
MKDDRQDEQQMVPKTSDQRAFFTVIFAFILTAVEVLSYLMVIPLLGVAYVLSPSGAYETWGSLTEGRRWDFCMSLITACLALGAAFTSRWLRRRINRTS